VGEHTLATISFVNTPVVDTSSVATTSMSANSPVLLTAAAKESKKKG
jgi:hypothetical protein